MGCWSALLKIVVLVSSIGTASAALSIASTHPGNMVTLGQSDVEVSSHLILACAFNNTGSILDVESHWWYGGLLVDSPESSLQGRALQMVGALFTEGEQGTHLIVTKLTYQDAGNFTCGVREKGSSVELTVTIQVKLAVRLDAIAEEVSTFNDSQHVGLACDMAGYIRADEELYWSRNGALIEESSVRYRVSYANGTRVAQFGGPIMIPSRVSTLTILDPEIDDSVATFSCAINNTDLSEEIQLTVLEASNPSGAPQNLRAVATSPTEISVTWDEVLEGQRNGNITSYDVLLSQSTFTEIPSNTSAGSGGPQRSTVLQHLEENLEYSIAVRARTTVGAGPYSTPVTAHTPPSAPTGYPSSIQVIALSPTSLLVSWEAVPRIEQNGLISQYSLSYSQSTFASIPGTVVEEVNASLSGVGEAVLEGLEEFVEYSVRIGALSETGVGPVSPPVSNLTLQDRPNAAPRNLSVVPLTPSSLSLTWIRPKEIDINGILTSYIVTFCLLVDGETENCTSLNASADETKTALLNLQENSSYRVSVAAHTVALGPAATRVGTTAARIEFTLPPVTEGSTPATPNVPVVGIVLGVVFGVLLIVLLAAVAIAGVMMYSVKRRKQAQQSEITGENLPAVAAEDDEVKKVPLELLESTIAASNSADPLENTAIPEPSSPVAVGAPEVLLAIGTPSEADPTIAMAVASDIDSPVEAAATPELPAGEEILESAQKAWHSDQTAVECAQKTTVDDNEIDHSNVTTEDEHSFPTSDGVPDLAPPSFIREETDV